MIQLHRANIFYAVLISLLFSLTFLYLTFPVLDTPFSMGDDHRVIAMAHPEKMEKAYSDALFGFKTDFTGAIGTDAKLGRFRPVSWLWVKTQCIIYSDNVFLWRSTNIFILFLSALFFTLTLLKLGAKKLSSFVALAVYVFGRNNETWWTLIPPAQNIGELFLLSGFYCWLLYREKKKNNFLLISTTLFLLSTLSKESFIFCIPFVFFIDLFYLNPRRKFFVGEYKLLSLSFFIPFGILLGIMIFQRRVYSYAYPYSAVSILAYNSWQFFFSSVFLIAPVLMFFFRSHIISRRNLLKLLFLTLSWFVVQLILLKGIRMDDQHHYLIPGLLMILVLSGISIEILKLRSGIIYFSLLLIYFGFAFLQGKNTYTNSRYYAATNKSYQKMADLIARKNPKRIIYVTHEAISGDWLTGTSAIIRNLNIKAPLYFCSMNDSIASWQVKFLKTRPPLSFKEFNGKTDSLHVGDWLIFPDDLCREHLFPWRKYDPDYYEKRVFESPYFEISAKQIRVKEKDMTWFGESYRKLTFHSLLYMRYELEHTGYYAMEIKEKHFQ